MKSIRSLWMTLFTGLLSVVVIAQGSDCPAIVQTALDSVDEICAETGRNQACYGNTLIDLQPQADVDEIIFEQPGDTVALSDVATMKLTPLNEEANVWGVATMKVQANIPDTVPGQNVTFLLFGDVVIDNAVVDDESGFTPMQAFYFRSGIGDADCDEAPESGLLIQTPEGVEEVLLNVNGANIALGSTAFLQAGAVPDSEDEFELTVSMIEGQGMIGAFGEIRPIPAGSWVNIKTDRNFNVIEPPSNPLPYNNERFSKLPIRALERRIEIAPSLTQAFIDEGLADFNPRRAFARLRSLGEFRKPQSVEQVVTNELGQDVTIHFSNGQSVLVPANGVQTVSIPPGRYTVELCATECVVVEEAPIMRDRQRTITEDSFRPRPNQ